MSLINSLSRMLDIPRNIYLREERKEKLYLVINNGQCEEVKIGMYQLDSCKLIIIMERGEHLCDHCAALFQDVCNGIITYLSNLSNVTR